MIEIQRHPDGYLVCRAAGRVAPEHYDAAAPKLERALEEVAGALDLLLDIAELDGLDLGGLKDDPRLAGARAAGFGRVAVVGAGTMQKMGLKLARPFRDAELRFFRRGEAEAAHLWLSEAPGAPAAT